MIAGWQPALFGLGRVRSSAVALAVGLVTVLVGGAVLIPEFGAEGAAIAAVIGDVVLCVAVYIALRLAGPGPWFSVNRILRVAVAAGIAVGVGLIPGVPIAVRAIAVPAVYLAAVLLLRGVPEEVLDTARSVSPWPRRSSGRT